MMYKDLSKSDLRTRKLAVFIHRIRRRVFLIAMLQSYATNLKYV